VNASGTLSLQVPELNFFDVLKQTLEGRRETYTNIAIAPQDELMFQPPAGAEVVATSRLGGIVAQPLEDSAEHLRHMSSEPAK
jgi:hypothetical protein